MTSKIDYASEVKLLLNARRLNKFMANYLMGMTEGGLDEGMWQEALDDAMVATDVGVESESEFYIFFYIDHFVEDVVDEIFGVKLNEAEEEQLKRYMFSLKESADFSDLLSFRVAVLQWLEENKKKPKKAHPNDGTTYRPLPKHNMAMWHKLANAIRKAVVSGVPQASALEKAYASLPEPERYDFVAWFKFYHVRQENNKYNVNKRIKELNRRFAGAMTELHREAAVSDETHWYVPKIRSTPNSLREERPSGQSLFDEQRVDDFESARSKMMGRIRSVDRLLEKYRKVLSERQVDDIDDALSNLRTKVRRLKLASTLRDTVIKTANILRSKDFAEGADALIRVAQEPIMPDAALDEPGEPEKPKAKKPDVNKDVILDDIVHQLDAASVILKNRDIVRTLSKIDLLLAGIGMGAFFEEISEAQAKLLDAYAYASNKIEDVLPKIRGGDAAESKIPELSPESEALAKEVGELSEGLTEKQLDSEKEESVLEVPEVPEAPKREVPEVPLGKATKRAPVAAPPKDDSVLKSIPALEQ